MLYRRSEREPVDRVFHALADPNRRVIVERLSRGPATVSELAQPLPMSLPAVVQHRMIFSGTVLNSPRQPPSAPPHPDSSARAAGCRSTEAPP
jgi:DNA-binding transcriptional ArsR family regulator